MTRNGKIARLPAAVREELNLRLRDGETGKELVAWLNSLPVVQAVVARRFGGKQIREQNLSEWRNGGYREWLVRQEVGLQAREAESVAGELNEAAGGKLTENLGTLVATRYAMAMKEWKGETTLEFRRRMRELRGLCRDVARMRRGDYNQGRLKLEGEMREWREEVAKREDGGWKMAGSEKRQTPISEPQGISKSEAPMVNGGADDKAGNGETGEHRTANSQRRTSNGKVEKTGSEGRGSVSIRLDPGESDRNFFSGGEVPGTGRNFVVSSEEEKFNQAGCPVHWQAGMPAATVESAGIAVSALPSRPLSFIGGCAREFICNWQAGD